MLISLYTKFFLIRGLRKYFVLKTAYCDVHYVLKDVISVVVMLKCHKSANRHESKITALGGFEPLVPH